MSKSSSVGNKRRGILSKGNSRNEAKEFCGVLRTRARGSQRGEGGRSQLVEGLIGAARIRGGSREAS